MKKILISIFSLIFIASIAINVQAATTGQITLTPSTNTIKPGNEFSITVKAVDSNNLNTVEYNSITITDANGMETNNITVKEIETIGEWFKMNNEGNTAFVFGGSATQAQDVCKITFKVNSGIVAGNYLINIDGLVMYSTNLQDDTTTIGKKTVSIKVEEDKTQEENKPSNNNNNSNKPNNNNNKPNNSTSKLPTKLPQTGVTNVTFFGILILSIMTVVSYVFYKKIKDV